MRTSVGSFLRKIRLAKGELLRDMAKNLDVSSAFLSAVENGKKKVPSSWLTKLKEVYSLTPNQIESFKQAIIEDSDTIELNMHSASNTQKQLAISFARHFDSLDAETTKQILHMLNKHEKE